MLKAGMLGHMSNMHAKAYAILHAVKHRKREKGVLKIFETDSLVMV